MDPIVISAGTLVVNVMALSITGVWVVSKIKETTAVLSVEIFHLRESIDKLGDNHEGIERRLRMVEEYVATCRNDIESLKVGV